MTTPNPVERLREAAESLTAWMDQAPTRLLNSFPSGLLNAVREIRVALAALPATPPEQPSSDAERERAIELWIHRIAAARFNNDIVAFDKAVQDGCDLMRSAPAPQPVPAPSIGESLASAGTHYVNPRTMQPVSTKVPAPPASDWRTDLGVTGNIGTGTVLP